MTRDELNKLKAIKESTQTALNNKKFKNLNTGDKDKLLEAMAKMLGLIK